MAALATFSPKHALAEFDNGLQKLPAINREDSQVMFKLKPNKQLTSLDTQRILSVIDDLIRRIQVITLLPYIVKNIDRFTFMLGHNLSHTVKEYDRAVTKYKSLDTQDQNRYDIVREKISDIMKDIFRLFRKNPTAITSLCEEKGRRSAEANNLINHLTLLKEHVFTKLSTSSNEEVDMHRMTFKVMVRERKCQAMLKKLESELAVCLEEKEKRITENDNKITGLQKSIKAIEQSSDLSNRKLLLKAEEMYLFKQQKSGATLAQLNDEYLKLSQQLQSNLKAYKHNEITLRKRKFKIETEVENWIQKYDVDMGQKQEELDVLSHEYAEERKQLQTLEEKYDEIRIKHDVIIEERCIFKERRAEQEKRLRAMVKAATILQSFWRAYLCRKALKGGGKKKGKKKAKKGKKK